MRTFRHKLQIQVLNYATPPLTLTNRKHNYPICLQNLQKQNHINIKITNDTHIYSLVDYKFYILPMQRPHFIYTFI